MPSKTTEWYERPYKLGAKAKVKGFPRNMYPPDAAPGHTPSIPAADVVAYKRIVSRAGRWPWAQFNNQYTNEFAHGRAGGNVGESGVAGLQRQLGLDSTGWIGQNTFELMQRIIIPVGLPHAGEHAMDANAITLLGIAFNKFHPPAPTLKVRDYALREAAKWIGYKETPVNRTMFGRWYGMDGLPWCAMFATYCFEVGSPTGSTSFVRGRCYSYVPNIVLDAAFGRNGLSLTSNPIPGDLVCYDWSGGDYDHVGIFEKGNANVWTAIEGNTSGSNNSNGGQVMRRDRTRVGINKVRFVRVAN